MLQQQHEMKRRNINCEVVHTYSHRYTWETKNR